MTKQLGLKSTISLALLCSAGSAWAQAGTSPASDGAQAGAGGLDEIVVTGQKRAGAIDVQNVSAAVTALDARAIEQTFAPDIRDIGRLAPSVQLNDTGTFKGFSNFFIRGIGQNLSLRTLDPAVGTFVDGIYVGFGPMSVLDTFGVESMEIFRGPQGTLFGRNVTGGAVNIRTQRPVDTFEARARMTLGNYDRINVAGMVNVPLSETLAARVSGYVEDSDGFYKNVLNGKTLGDTNNKVIRPALRWRPNSRLDVQLLGEYMRGDGGSAVASALDSRLNPRLLGANFTPSPAAPQSVFGYTPLPLDTYKVAVDIDGYTRSKVNQLILDGSYDMDHGVATLIAGYRKVIYNTSSDFDGTPFKTLAFPDNRERQRQYSAELRYASKFSDVIEFTAGLYYYTQTMHIGERREFFGGGTAAAPVIVRSAGVARAEDTSVAAFTEARLHALDTLTFVAGGRYTHDKKKIVSCPQSPNAVLFASLAFADCPVALLRGSRSWSSFSPKLGVEYQPDSDTLAYATFTKGYRSGNFNARGTNLIQLGPVNPEYVTTYEAGLKLRLLNNHVRFNNAVYYSDYKDMQRTVNLFVPVNGVPQNLQLTTNAAAARVWGIESELQAQVSQGLRIDASGSYTNARYRKFPGFDANRNGVYEPTIDDALALKLRFERVPTWQFAIAGNYTVPTFRGDTTLRVAYTWVSDAFTETNNTPVTKSKAYGLLDASLKYEDERDFRVSFFLRNALDKTYVVIGSDGGLNQVVNLGSPRTFGIELGYDFR